MEERKWEDLEMDCLVNVLGRVSMESLLLDIPFVCKSWHKASLSPLCWKRLMFPKIVVAPWLGFGNCLKDRFMDVYRVNELSETAFIKFVIDRSCRNATALVLPMYCTEEAFKYAADECPELKILGLHCNISKIMYVSTSDTHRPSPIKSNYGQSPIIQLIGKWKNLECLCLDFSVNLSELLLQISLNCKSFSQLLYFRAYIGEEEASAIVTLLPKIRYLSLKSASINRENLVTILRGCKELVYLDVSKSKGFDIDDKILELASHIPTFKYEGARLFDDDDYDDRPWEITAADVYDDYVSD